MVSISLPICSNEYNPPLAPPSKFSLSIEDMLEQFKIFVIQDIFQGIIRAKENNQNHSFSLTDIELQILIQDKIQKNSLLTKSKSINTHVWRHRLYLQVDDHYYECYRLEVLPGKFEFKTQTIDKKIWQDVLRIHKNVN